MGCCSSGRNKPHREDTALKLDASNSSLEASPTNVQWVKDYLKIVIKEIHLTKTIERILKKPNEIYFKIKVKSLVQDTTPVTIEGLHYTWPEVEEFKINLEKDLGLLEIILCAKKDELETELGYVCVDIEVFKKHVKFSGSAPIYYRCLKTGMVLCDISKYSSVNDVNFVTLGNISGESMQFLYLPAKDYPLQYTSVINRTPQFVSGNSSNSIENGVAVDGSNMNIITHIKDPKVSFQDLSQCLKIESPDVIYHACEKLRFFACQSSYAAMLVSNDLGVIQHILFTYSQDPYVSLQTLWVLYRITENSSEIYNRWNKDKHRIISTIIKIWKEFHSLECVSLCIEIVVKYIPDNIIKTKLIYLCSQEQMIQLIFETLRRYNSTQIISPCLLILSECLEIPNKPEYWDLMDQQGLIELLDRFLYFHILNHEIVITILKILQCFTNQIYRNLVASKLHFERLNSILDYYIEDLNKVKSVINVISELITLPPILKSEGQFNLGVEMLIKILERHIDSKIAMDTVFMCLTRVVAAVPGIPEVLINPDSLDLYCQSLALADQDIKICAEILKLLTLLSEKNKDVKDSIVNSEEFKEKFRYLLKLHSVPSAGSLVGQEKHIQQIRKYANDLLGVAE